MQQPSAFALAAALLALLVIAVHAQDITPVTPAPDTFPATSSSRCNQLWEVHPATDTCDSIAAASGLTVADLAALNSGLDCAALTAGQLVCTGNTKETYCGDSTYTTGSGDTCTLVSTMFGLASTLLASLNPTLACGDGTTALPAGTKICIPATLPSSAATSAAGCPPTHTSVVTISDFLSGCSGLASRLGLTVPQLTQLNPQLLDLAGVCTPIVNTVVCKGCTGTVCGTALSPAVKNFLNFPTLNQHFCSILAECSGVTVTLTGAAGSTEEQLVITATSLTPAIEAAGAAGYPAIASFFGPGGTLSQYPGSAIQMLISPNFYTNAPTANALIEFVAELELPTGSRKLKGTIRPRQSQNPATKTVAWP